MLARALPVWPVEDVDQHLDVPDIEFGDTRQDHEAFGQGEQGQPVPNSGIMWRAGSGPGGSRQLRRKFHSLGDVLVPDDEVPESFFIPKENS